MKNEVAVLNVLFPKVRAQMLRLLFDVSNKSSHVRELMRQSGLALSTVQDELRKLQAIGLIRSYSKRNYRFYVADLRHPLFRDICRIVHVGDKLPGTHCSALARRRSSRRKKATKRRRPLRMKPDRTGVTWGIFSPPRRAT